MEDLTKNYGEDLKARIRASFERQSAMATLGAVLQTVEPGLVEIRLGTWTHLTQQNGFLHAGATTTLVDTACGYAALTLAPEGADVLTIEFKVNLLSPAKGDSFVARGRVKKAGRTISVCEGELLAFDAAGGAGKTVAIMLATIFVRS